MIYVIYIFHEINFENRKCKFGDGTGPGREREELRLLTGRTGCAFADNLFFLVTTAFKFKKFTSFCLTKK